MDVRPEPAGVTTLAPIPALVDVVHDNRSYLWCGPAVISAMTGRPTREVMMLLREVSGRRAITGVRDTHLKAVLATLGFRVVEHEARTRPRPLLRDWVQHNAERFAANPAVLVVEAGPGGWHYVVVQGDSFLDSGTGGRVVPMAHASCLDFPVESWMTFEPEPVCHYAPRDLAREARSTRALRALARKHGFMVERGETGWRIDAPMLDDTEDPFESWEEVDVFAARERAETYAGVLRAMDAESSVCAQALHARARQSGISIEREFDCFEVIFERLNPDPYAGHTYVSSWGEVERRISAYERMLEAQKMEKRTLFFTMVRHPAGGWTRVGNAYSSRTVATSWLPFVRGAWRGLRAKVAQCTVQLKDGKVCEQSRRLLDEKFNLDA